jgi:ubiquinone/menaquinone biosynthesis C-methylase UbiE
MRWVVKAAVQGAISLAPGGHRLNYYLQKNVSRRLPQVGEKFDLHAEMPARHLAALERVRPGLDRSTLKCYEFGAGWDLIGPISMWALGVDQQIILDIRFNIKLELVNATILKFATDSAHLEQVLAAPLRAVDAAPVTRIDELATRFGITYLAPADARSVPLPDACIDFVSSSVTLEHIRAQEITSILLETRRLLRPGGVVSSVIDMKDHYQYIDPNLSCYNFLRFPSWQWRFLNPSLQWQNRLRHPQYLELFADAGYEILADKIEPASDGDLRELASMRIAREFARFSPADLGTKSTHLVAAPAPAR